jgi:hypothetical protein
MEQETAEFVSERAGECSFRMALALVKRRILALTPFRIAQQAHSPEIEPAADSHYGSGRSPALTSWACKQAAGLMAKYFIFERLESGRLLWMGEAEDLEDAEAKLQNLAESNPGCDYFAFDMETGTKVRITSHNDPT